MAEQLMQGRVLVPGKAQGTLLVLPEPLSLWGGLNPETGEIIDRHHPSCGQVVTGRVLVMPAGRGSSSAASILLEAIRLQTNPAAILLAEVDGILALGGVVAQELYGSALPLIVLDAPDYAALESGQTATIALDGTVTVGKHT